MRTRTTDRANLYLFALLFPPLWPLGLAMALCDAAESVVRAIKKYSNAEPANHGSPRRQLETTGKAWRPG
jgi:hypothetical protein